MLSKVDIQKEIGKGICIYPLNLENIKENSINLCTSEFAWATTSQEIFCDIHEKDKNKRFSLSSDEKHSEKLTIEKGRSAIIDGEDGNKYIVLLPNSTTLIETKEILSVSSYIGGTYHSKVGIVSKGIGHIGTMVGPNFSGESLVALHNVSNNIITMLVGESFVSVIFYYLSTPYTQHNLTISGHTEKFQQLGISLSEEQSNSLNADWKKQFDEVCKEMRNSESYKDLQEELKQKRKEALYSFLNKRNIIIFCVIILIFLLLFLGACYLDSKTEESIWVNRFFDVGCSGILATILAGLFQLFKTNTK